MWGSSERPAWHLGQLGPGRPASAQRHGGWHGEGWVPGPPPDHLLRRGLWNRTGSAQRWLPSIADTNRPADCPLGCAPWVVPPGLCPVPLLSPATASSSSNELGPLCRNNGSLGLTQHNYDRGVVSGRPKAQLAHAHARWDFHAHHAELQRGLPFKCDPNRFLKNYCTAHVSTAQAISQGEI